MKNRDVAFQWLFIGTEESTRMSKCEKLLALAKEAGVDAPAQLQAGDAAIRRRVVVMDAPAAGSDARKIMHDVQRESVRAGSYCDCLTLVKNEFEQVVRSYPEFLRSVQVVAVLRSGNGWSRVARILRMAKSTRLFGGKVNIAEVLQTPIVQRLGGRAIVKKRKRQRKKKTNSFRARRRKTNKEWF